MDGANIGLTIFFAIVDSTVSVFMSYAIWRGAKNKSTYWVTGLVVLAARLFLDLILGSLITAGSSSLFGIFWIGFSIRDILLYVVFGCLKKEDIGQSQIQMNYDNASIISKQENAPDGIYSPNEAPSDGKVPVATERKKVSALLVITIAIAVYILGIALKMILSSIFH